MDSTRYLTFITYQQDGFLLEMKQNRKYSVGSGAKDDCRIGQLSPSQFTISAEGSSVVIRFSFLKKQILRVNSINTIAEIPGLVIYIRDYLVVQEKVIDLAEGVRVLLGRTDGADIQIMNPFVSGKHLTVEKKNGRLYLEDMHSSNGTFVNERRISTQVLESGQTFCILTMRFLFDGSRLLVRNVYDTFYDRTQQVQPRQEEPSYTRLPRPEGVDLKLSRLANSGIQIERFQQDFIVSYVGVNSTGTAYTGSPHADGGPAHQLPMYLFERDFSDELISPKAFLYNGNQAILYAAKANKSLRNLWNYITLDELIRILRSFFDDVQKLDSNRDIDIQHVFVDLSAIYVDVITLNVSLIYIPFLEMSMTRHDDYLNAVRYAITDVLGTFIANTAQEKEILDKIQQVLTNAEIPLESIGHRLKKIGDLLHLFNDIYRDDESLLERISSRTTKV